MSYARCSLSLLLFAIVGCSADFPISPQNSANGTAPVFSSNAGDACLYDLRTNCSNGMTAAGLMNPAEFDSLGGFNSSVHDGITGGSGLGTWDIELEQGAPVSSCTGSYPGCNALPQPQFAEPSMMTSSTSAANCRPNTNCIVVRGLQVRNARGCPSSIGFNFTGSMGIETWNFSRTGSYSKFGQSMGRYQGQFGVAGGGSNNAVSFVHCDSGMVFSTAKFYYSGGGGGGGGAPDPY